MLAVSQYGNVRTGGAERYFHETVTRMCLRGLQVETLHGDETGSAARLHRPWKVFSGGFHPSWRAHILQHLREYRPDIIYAHFTVPGLVDITLRCARALQIPVCLVYHSDVTGADWPRRLVGTAYHRTLGRGTLRCAGSIVVASDAYRQTSPWLSSLEEAVFHYAPPGVDDAIAGGVRSEGKPYLLFVGKVDVESKGFGLLYEAWSRLRSKYPDLGLTAVGPIPRRHFPGVSHIDYLHQRRRLGDLYASAVATVLPSTSTAESFGMVLAEALVAGCPVVGSAVGGIGAIVSPGVNGFLFRPGDIAALTSALDAILQHQDLLRLSIGRERYRDRFSWERTTDEILAAIFAVAPKLNADKIRHP
ncbi:glycosyltransferase family 4 protein [Thiohalocapsa marina]|uniref:Glycosyltransferase family 4 protein n=1 Tax=Thiohalocapsa marina TaxID=424902 RepID=A0A5M8FVN8_9GAMM|nr:glycosyltransferase family 4 protein [Thiohalocapsa marina]KAA6187866.1 glycosyltransferase family 4 protein [Thiohalocapsa marina]